MGHFTVASLARTSVPGAVLSADLTPKWLVRFMCPRAGGTSPIAARGPREKSAYRERRRVKRDSERYREEHAEWGNAKAVNGANWRMAG